MRIVLDKRLKTYQTDLISFEIGCGFLQHLPAAVRHSLKRFGNLYVRIRDDYRFPEDRASEDDFREELASG